MSRVIQNYVSKEELKSLNLIVYFDKIIYDNSIVQIRGNIFNNKNKYVEYVFGQTKKEILENIKKRYKK